MSYEFGSRSEAPTRVARRKDEEIPGQWLWPHYTNPAFDEATTVFLDAESRTTPTGYGTDEVEGAEYWYGDRIPADWDKLHEAAERAAQELGTKSTARYFELQLQQATDEPDLQLVHLLTGVNRGNGFPYHVYGVVHGERPDSQAPVSE